MKEKKRGRTDGQKISITIQNFQTDSFKKSSTYSINNIYQNTLFFITQIQPNIGRERGSPCLIDKLITN